LGATREEADIRLSAQNGALATLAALALAAAPASMGGAGDGREISAAERAPETLATPQVLAAPIQAGAPPKPLGRSELRGTIAYVDTGITVEQLDPASGIVTPLTFPGRARDRDPVFSPDGRSIAFFRSGRGAGSGLYTVDARNTTDVLVRPTRRVAALTGRAAGTATSLAWSRDGRTLAFSTISCSPANRASRLPIVLASKDGRVAPRTIFALPAPKRLADVGRIEFSPNGKRLLYIVWEYGPPRDDEAGCDTHRPDAAAYTIGVDGRQRRQLLRPRDVREIFLAAWSPDGTQIAYQECEFECTVSVSRADGRAERMLIEALSADVDIAWRPRSDEVLVADSGELRAIGTKTREIRHLARTPDDEFGVGSPQILSITPDGRKVAYVTGYPPELHVVRLSDGSRYDRPAGAYSVAVHLRAG
jgi:dipeptidyl aminopeptidase/acylaminoacyl peptidase